MEYVFNAHSCDVTSVPKSESKHEIEREREREAKYINYMVQWIQYVMWSDHKYTLVHTRTHAYNIIIDIPIVLSLQLKG